MTYTLFFVPDILQSCPAAGIGQPLNCPVSITLEFQSLSLLGVIEVCAACVMFQIFRQRDRKAVGSNKAKSLVVPTETA